MKAILIGLVSIIFLMTIISATSITPSQIELNLSAGEQTSINFTINSDDNSVLQIVSDNSNCVIVNELYEVNKGVNYKTLTFYIPADTDLSDKECNFDFKFLDTKENIQTFYVHSGGGGTRVIQNRTNVTVEVPNYIDREVTKEITKEVPIETIKKIYKVSIWVSLGILLSLGILSILVIIFFKLYTNERRLERI